MTHQRGPLLWTIAIYAMNTNCLTKMLQEINQHNLHLQHSLSFSLLVLTHTSTVFSPFCFLGFALSPWKPPSMLSSRTRTRNPSCPWLSLPANDAVNGLFSLCVFFFLYVFVLNYCVLVIVVLCILVHGIGS